MSRPKKILLSGNEAIAEAAIAAGCRFYAGYPITPQNEIPAYMSHRMPQVDGVFIQAESELAAINMVFGASAAGVRAMTSSSSPGISLKQEGISYLAGCQLPAVIVNIMRGGPGLGNIAPSQSDYFQATKGGGHGDYRCIVLAPSRVQEALDLTKLAFELADKYRNPVIILGDGMLGQMMEPVTTDYPECSNYSGDSSGSRCATAENNFIRDTDKKSPACQQAGITQIKKPWALTGAKDRKPNIIRSLFLAEGVLEELNKLLQKKYKEIEEKECLFENFHLNDSKIILVAYGTMARVAKQAMLTARKQGLKVGLIRPISLWPYPKKAFDSLQASSIKPQAILVIEMSCGQMLEDVQLAVNGKAKVEFLGRAGGGIPTQEEILNKLQLLNR